ncbi:MAG: hypothetical protein M9882_05595 [Homoserinimonas sp.]|nr:hypothetical protein [Homoserinimonas sp.]
MLRHGKAISASAMLVLLTLGLSGCTVPAKTAARLIDGKFVFVSCQDFTYDTISVASTDYDDWNAGYTEQWRATGIASVSAGDEITYGVTPGGLVNAIGPFRLPLAHHKIDVYLRYTPITNSPGEVVGLFDSRKLSSDYWLRGDGSQDDKPCD